MKLKILLLGANGRTGRQLLRRALGSGDEVTAVVRTPDRLADVEHARLRVHVGSACDPDVLAPLMQAHDAVVSVLGPRWPSRAASAVYPDSAAAIVEAMRRSRRQRLVLTSSALLFEDDRTLSRALRWMVPAIVEGAREMESRILGSSLDWTIARTSFLTDRDDPAYRCTAGALPPGAGTVSRGAVADFILSELRQPRHHQQVVGLCG